MFGYLVASVSGLTEEEFLRYKACYCGLCLSLKERHGQISRLTLNYDMTFLILLLAAVYEPEETGGKCRCIAHPKTEHEWQRSIFSDYAADMNVALSYLKCEDDWRDDGNLASLAAHRLLKSAYEEISERYPRQCTAMKSAIEELSALEKAGAEDPDGAAACFGRLMGEIFVYYPEDHWAGCLYSLGDNLGRFIYLMDACMDLDDDALHDHYNPLRRYYGLDNKERFSDILKLFMVEVVRCFDYLPIVQDSILLKNILCSGLWQQFEKKYKEK